MNFQKRLAKIYFALGFGVVLFFQNCGVVMDSTEDSLNSSAASTSRRPSSDIPSQLDTTVDQNPIALLNAYELKASYANLTGMSLSDKISGDNATNSMITKLESIESVFVRAEPLLSSNSGLKQINAPLLVMSTTLAGEYCDALIRFEANVDSGRLNSAQRVYFKNIDFSLNTLDDRTYLDSVDRMTKDFWGRPASAQEKALLMQLKQDQRSSDYLTDFKANPILMLMSCSAILSSFETQIL